MSTEKKEKLYGSLATKYRPRNFSDVCEQSCITDILLEKIKNGGTFHPMLFTGPAGTGKTTCARIFASNVNGNQGNVNEIDAARNNGVDDVRSIIEDSNFKSLGCKYKVYIIDECHMFSNGAWNAMLKLLEEPPQSTIFILCTTDPQKIPATVLSRVQRYDFKRISYQTIIKRLKYIIDQENELKDCSHDLILIDKECYDYIAKISEGGMRDAITMLDKCVGAKSDLAVSDVIEILGTSNYETLFLLLDLILDGNKKDCIKLITDLYNQGTDLKQFIRHFYLFLIDVNKFLITEDYSCVKIPSIYSDNLSKLYVDECTDVMCAMKVVYSDIKWESDVKDLFIACLLKLCNGELKI